MNKKNKIINIILLYFILITLMIISIFTIHSATNILNKFYDHLYLKQLLWYLISFIIMIFILKLKNNNLLKYSSHLYIIGIILLIVVLIFGNEINSSKCWLEIPHLGSFQPSEFMKLPLILVLARILNEYHFEEKKTFKKESKLILKCFIITLIPSLLVFLEPDTGIVIFYIFIFFSMLFICGIRKIWFIIFTILILLISSTFFILYFNYKNIFINIFGNSFFYRIHRILDWTKTSGMQLENSMIAIGSSSVFGKGYNNTQIYFPEPHTDFIFAVFTSNFGFLGSLTLIILIFSFIFILLKIGKHNTKTINKMLIIGISTCFIYPFIWNISMTMGLLPITGIPLPFISYGGSNLIINIILFTIIINIVKEKY